MRGSSEIPFLIRIDMRQLLLKICQSARAQAVRGMAGTGMGLLLCVTLLACGKAAAQESAEWKLVWSDEFNRDGRLDSTVWNYENGYARNEEAQWYQPDNAYCKDGKLVIVARKETGRKNPLYEAGSQDWRKKREYIEYTSSSVTTAGKKEFLYGRMEVRAKIPTAGGAWPAIWLLGSGMDWPSCGEIDIMEHSYLHDYVQHTLHSHYIDVYTGHNTDHVDLEYSGWDTGYNAGQYNVYSVEVTDDEIVMYCNEVERLRYANMKLDNEADLKQWPFSGGYYLILSVGPAGRNEISDDDVPSYMEVDWVRVSRLD